MNQTNTLDQKLDSRATVTIHTTPDVRARFERLAKAQDRSISYLGDAAIKSYLANEEAFVNAVLEGLSQSEAGEGITTEDLQSRLHGAVDKVANIQ